MSVRNLAAIEKRIAKVEQRARVLDVPPLLLIDVLSWPKADRDAYARGDDATCAALEKKHVGPLPNPPSRIHVAAIVVSEFVYDDAEAWRYDVGDDDEPFARSPLPQAELDKIAARNAAMREQIEIELELERLERERREPVAAPFVDPNPGGDPRETLYFNEQTGYPVTRAEHQLREQRAREHAARLERRPR